VGTASGFELPRKRDRERRDRTDNINVRLNVIVAKDSAGFCRWEPAWGEFCGEGIILLLQILVTSCHF
jgi:hypothetical protein